VPSKGTVAAAQASDWDAPDEQQAASGGKQEKKAEVLEGRALYSSTKEASGFDDDENKEEVKMSMVGDESKGLAMTFDFSPEKPKKAMPKGLEERLSRPKSSSGTRKKEKAADEESKHMSKEEKKELAKERRKKSRTIVAPTKQTTALPPPSVKPHMKLGAVRPPPGAKQQEPALAKPLDEDGACGAPVRPTDSFVAAAKTTVVEAAPLAPKAAAEGGANDFLSDLLNTDTSAPAATPFKGSANHGFVPDFHCLGCDNQVMRVENHVWTNDVPYMFLRNNYPNVMRLREHLKSQQGCIAYCCQCSSRSGEAGASLELIAEGLRWKVVTA